jgi:hypothetical protein
MESLLLRQTRIGKMLSIPLNIPKSEINSLRNGLRVPIFGSSLLSVRKEGRERDVLYYSFQTEYI